ncbi:GNAT family N-acetyltransferase [Aquimarina brevivitae]|uniref:Acetyltransferase (GNAT) family protein n=1 Tax=Aquimarina brevivitae TaxID=323412 RepID=A0A4Q7NY04_9FLAO|nr:GNAT family N-acetyltransferase [Aquimarina brevivitae]RZS92296.1 acetyltransferase (GNAT) family protein [Aquimarina brevivitae]
MQISFAKFEDLPEILSLQKECYIEEAELYEDFNIPPLTQTLEELQTDYSKEKIIKIESEGKIIGSVRGQLLQHSCQIGRLIVDKKFRNKGLGKQLMNAIESEFITAKRFELFTGHKSERNLYLYKKLGYKIFDKKKVNDKLTFIFLEKNTTNAAQ